MWNKIISLYLKIKLKREKLVRSFTGGIDKWLGDTSCASSCIKETTAGVGISNGGKPAMVKTIVQILQIE